MHWEEPTVDDGSGSPAPKFEALEALASHGAQGTFTVVERRSISDALALAAQRWLTQHRLDEVVDESWLELVCEDGDVFRPDNLMLHLAVPPCDVAPGDAVDVGRTQTIIRLWPDVDAPRDEVPKDLALARTFERAADLWVGACELPAPIRELFTVEHPDAMLSVMNATRRTLNRGAMSISGDPTGGLSFTLVEGDIAAWGSTEARVPEAFAYWLDAGPATELAVPLRDAARAVGSLGGLRDLIIVNEHGIEARCPLVEDRPAPTPLPGNYFEEQARGRVDGLRIDRAGGLGRDALAAIANLRPRDVTFAVADDGTLLIAGGPGDADAFRLDGRGFATPGDRRNVPIALPYVVALAMHDGAAGGTVDLMVDAEWGRLHRADQSITVQWRR